LICSNIGSMTSIVKDGFTGLYFKPGNAQDLSEKITQFIENDKLQKLMGSNCLNTFLDQYTPEKNYEQLISIYKGAIAESGVRSS